MSHPDLAFGRHFAGLPDPRVNRTKRHRLTELSLLKGMAAPASVAWTCGSAASRW